MLGYLSAGLGLAGLLGATGALGKNFQRWSPAVGLAGLGLGLYNSDKGLASLFGEAAKTNANGDIIEKATSGLFGKGGVFDLGTTANTTKSFLNVAGPILEGYGTYIGNKSQADTAKKILGMQEDAIARQRAREDEAQRRHEAAWAAYYPYGTSTRI